MGHRSGTEVVVQPGQHGRCQHPHLRGPRCAVGTHREPPGLELFWGTVCSKLVTDDLRPPALNPTDRERLLPPSVTHQLVDGFGDRLRVAAVGTRTGVAVTHRAA